MNRILVTGSAGFIGNNQPVSLRHFITAIETACGKKAKENLLPMQAGDIPVTFADVDELIADTGFKPSTSIEDGIGEFVDWYKNYLKLKEQRWRKKHL